MSISFNFKIIKKDDKTRARTGEINTPHGVIETPNFIPVGTRATVRSLSPQDLKEIGAQIIFGNTYHLHLQPGEETVKEFGGLSKFMNWNGPTITDSGGFQVFSLIHRENKNGAGRLTHIVRPAHYAQENSQSNTRSLSEKRQDNDFVLEEKSESFFSCLANGQTSSFKKEVTSEKTSSSKTSQVISFSGDSHLDPRESSPALVRITDDGVTFRSHIDGSLHTFTPEKSIEIQQKLGADIILVFDECAPYPFTHESTKKAMERTHSWSIRCLEYFNSSNLKSQNSKPKLKTKNFENKILEQVQDDIKNEQALYGIVQGGVYKDLREESAKFIGSQDFDGIAIGGVSVGESKKEMREAVDWSVPYLPEDKPRHLLGVGEIDDLFAGVERGMDTFDCVIPTRFGRYGIAFVDPLESEEIGKYRINLPKAKYARDQGPISKKCKCSTCQNYTRGYINHLFRSDELLGYRLVSYHNVYFIINLMKEIRKAILEDRFEKLKKEWVE